MRDDKRIIEEGEAKAKEREREEALAKKRELYGLLVWWQSFIHTWAHSTFPHHTTQSIANHHLRESVELCLAAGLDQHDIRYAVQKSLEKHMPGSKGERRPKHIPEELADSLVLTLTMAGYLAIDVENALADKMAENMRRQWGPEDDQGVREHL